MLLFESKIFKSDASRILSKLKGFKTRKVNFQTTAIPFNQSFNLDEPSSNINTSDQNSTIEDLGSSSTERIDKEDSSKEPIEKINSTSLEVSNGDNSSSLVEKQSNISKSISYPIEPDPMETFKQLNRTILKGDNKEVKSLNLSSNLDDQNSDENKNNQNVSLQARRLISNGSFVQENSSAAASKQINSTSLETSNEDDSTLLGKSSNISKSVSIQNEPDPMEPIRQLNRTILKGDNRENSSEETFSQLNLTNLTLPKCINADNSSSLVEKPSIANDTNFTLSVPHEIDSTSKPNSTIAALGSLLNTSFKSLSNILEGSLSSLLNTSLKLTNQTNSTSMDKDNANASSSPTYDVAFKGILF